ncbi:MAG TPA: universal stress protein [Ktedonobacterales bacterium]|nr:universal stress protein [Ktedonobacterales bacterium]
MFRRILVPLDGSQHAERALPIAARIAHGANATLVLCRVVGRPSALALYETARPTSSPGTALLHEQARAYLATVAGSPIVAGLRTETLALEGLVAEEILSVISRSVLDLVVICSHGHTEPTRWLLGSIAEKVARLSEAPVLVLREQNISELERVTEQNDPQHPLQVLVPLDGSPLAESALQPTVDLAAALTRHGHTALHLLSVLPPSGETDETPSAEAGAGTNTAREELTQQVSAYLERVGARFQQHAPRQDQQAFSSSVMFDTDAATRILRSSGQDVDGAVATGMPGKCHMIAMTTHGSGGKRPWSIGTVANRVLYATELPMLLVRP